MSEGIDAKAMVAPDPPQEPAAVSTAHFIRITWSPPGFDGASPILGYRVYLVKGSGDAVCLGGPSTQGVTEPVLAFLHEVEYDGVSRRYYVTALNAEGESGPSTITSSPVYQVPQPPADLETIWGEGSVEIRWDPPTDDGGTPVLSYTLYRLSQGEEAFVPMVSLSPEELSFRDMGLINGETYAYRLTATNLVGESEPTAPVEAIPAGLPGAPEGLQAEGGVGTVHLSWGPPLDHGGHPVSGYTVYRTVDGGSMEPVMQLDGGTLEWDDTEVEDGVQYLYSIEAHTDAGTSVMSEIAGATPFGPPTGPVNFIAHWVDGQVHLTWSAPLDDRGSTLMGYRIHRHDRDLANMTELSPMALTFLDREFEPGATYNYTIYAYNSAGVSVGAEASITIPLPEPGPPKSS
ncbi:MAG: hypothetical protein GWN18_08575, partial [Thermoplasmata archaeon]|nr:fibronectin type III domain-containing protein [Thermoplasmata archaeon]NIS12094.1 fibronectin type III domain-containing protein [Thermoplasmata archaeon]NIS20018.1 fibronectin type III domain-containing protein [Thermoplasmata archaeon]NIT77215.1 fibronectin type III domain-containing protein [Thermoplasmata archaeon]NIU49124.1 fibronectin type III domain-containing protein [Thermoplasmata archaeon]